MVKRISATINDHTWAKAKRLGIPWSRLVENGLFYLTESGDMKRKILELMKENECLKNKLVLYE